jgi:hypothetical protein
MPVVFTGTGFLRMKKMKGMKIMKEMSFAKRGKHYAGGVVQQFENVDATPGEGVYSLTRYIINKRPQASFF